MQLLVDSKVDKHPDVHYYGPASGKYVLSTKTEASLPGALPHMTMMSIMMTWDTTNTQQFVCKQSVAVGLSCSCICAHFRKGLTTRKGYVREYIEATWHFYIAMLKDSCELYQVVAVAC